MTSFRGSAPTGDEALDVAPMIDGVPAVDSRGAFLVTHAMTPLSDVELYEAAVAGYLFVFGYTRNYLRGIVGWSMLCLENARGKAIHNNNFGNQDAGPKWNGAVFELTADEIIGGKRVQRTKQLRAYGSPREGAAGYWRRLAEGYGAALPFFDAGDGEGAARKLKELRYYTGDVEAYAHSMRLLVAEGRRRFGEEA